MVNNARVVMYLYVLKASRLYSLCCNDHPTNHDSFFIYCHTIVRILSSNEHYYNSINYHRALLFASQPLYSIDALYIPTSYDAEIENIILDGSFSFMFSLSFLLPGLFSVHPALTAFPDFELIVPMPALCYYWLNRSTMKLNLLRTESMCWRSK